MCDDKYEPELYGSPEEEEAWSAARKSSKHAREDCALPMNDHDAGLCVGRVIWQTGKPSPWCFYCHGDIENHAEWCVRNKTCKLVSVATLVTEYFDVLDQDENVVVRRITAEQAQQYFPEAYDAIQEARAGFLS